MELSVTHAAGSTRDFSKASNPGICFFYRNERLLNEMEQWHFDVDDTNYLCEKEVSELLE